MSQVSLNQVSVLAHGYRVTMNGVILQRPNAPGYCRPDVYVVDDLR
jgi:hypothetical protein